VGLQLAAVEREGLQGGSRGESSFRLRGKDPLAPRVAPSPPGPLPPVARTHSLQAKKDLSILRWPQRTFFRLDVAS